MFSASAHSNRHPDRLSRFFCTTSCNKEKQSKLHSCIPVPSTSTTKCLDAANTRKKVANAKKLTNEVTDVWFPSIISNSSHRDGAIYKNMALKGDWRDIKDRSETRLEPMTFSKPIQRLYFPRNMLQCFSLRLADCSINNDSIQLYGYIATRDDRDCMVNYVLNRSRDDPIMAHKGSLIPMTGPKRGIEMVCRVLIEFDMRIKNGGQKEDDLQLIDGAINCNLYRPWKPVIHRIRGDCDAVDVSLACVESAMEATIEVSYQKCIVASVYRCDPLSMFGRTMKRFSFSQNR